VWGNASEITVWRVTWIASCPLALAEAVRGPHSVYPVYHTGRLLLGTRGHCKTRAGHGNMQGYCQTNGREDVLRRAIRLVAIIHRWSLFEPFCIHASVILGVVQTVKHTGITT
jgi:hypothetical protein